jgi:hypothetical protein
MKIAMSENEPSSCPETRSIITGITALTTAVSGLTIEIGPKARAAYRQLIAIPEAMPAYRPAVIDASEKTAPRKELAPIASSNPKLKEIVVTEIALTFFAASAPTKSA